MIDSCDFVCAHTAEFVPFTPYVASVAVPRALTALIIPFPPHPKPLHAHVFGLCCHPYEEPSFALPLREIHPLIPPFVNVAFPVIFPVLKSTLAELKFIQPTLGDHA